MPEIVDVEIVRCHLQRWMRGRTIVDAHGLDPYVLRPTSATTFLCMLVGRAVLGVTRRGKWLRIQLDGELRLFSHLGMTGDWIRCDDRATPQPWTRARLDVRRGHVTSRICYVDPRRFGQSAPSGLRVTAPRT